MADFDMTGIKEIIVAQLPEQVGKVLRSRLKQADEDAAELDATKRRLAIAEERLDSVNRDFKAYKSHGGDLDERQSTASRLEAELVKKERDLALRELQLELNAQKTIAGSYKELMGMLVRNTTYKETIMGGEVVHHPAVAMDQSRGIYNSSPARTTTAPKETTAEAI